MFDLEVVHGEVCATCAHYRCHFICRNGYYSPLWYGHCVYPRPKKRYPDQICLHWTLDLTRYGPPE